MSNVVDRTGQQFLWYMAGLSSFVIPGGIQMILLPWLAVVQLGEGGDRLGILQMSAQLPGLVLILVGGLLADRIDMRSILMRGHILAAIPASLLAVAMLYGHLSYWLLIFYALAMGTLTAFITPARDGMLNRVAGGRLQRAVTISMGLNFGAQVFGYIAAGFADQTGAVPLLFLHSGIMLAGVIAVAKLDKVPPIPRLRGSSALSEIKAGLMIVRSSNRMAPSFLLVVFMGLFYGGAFVVLNPLIVRDTFQGSAMELSLSYGAFTIGTISMTVLLVTSGGLERQGKSLLLALVMGGLCLLSASLTSSFGIYLTSIFAWGMCGAVAMSMSRTIMQESAPVSHRARVISIFSLGNLGGMPIGALILGFTAEAVGPQPTLWLAAGGMCTIAALVWIFSGIATVSALSAEEAAKLQQDYGD